MSRSKPTNNSKLSLERKLRMHEAREAIIDRLARDLPTNIDLERYLNVVVSEIGRMLDADRCDLLQLDDKQELRISHEWRRDKSVPKSEGTKIPFDTDKARRDFDFTKPIRINDTTTGQDIRRLSFLQRRSRRVRCLSSRSS